MTQQPDVLEAALLAVARTRATGMHYYGHLLGITTRRPANGRACPHLVPDPAVTPGAVPPVGLAVIAGLALGSALRARLGAGRRLGTVSLSLHHMGTDIRPPVTADADTVWVAPDPGEGVMRCDLTDATGRTVGAGQAWWALERGTSVGEELTAPEWDAGAADGTASGVLSLGPSSTNRVGHVQGGALYGIGLAEAAQAVGPDMAAADGHLQFLRPADGEGLVAEGTTLRRGRGATFAESRLSVDGRLTAVGRYAFRPA